MLYNLYRPSNYDEVCGQEDTLLTLRKQAQSGNFGHAYILAGYRGTGKTSIGRILSKAVNCLNPTKAGPCNTCANCLAAKRSLDIVELDAASNNGVSDIKELISQVKYQPVQMPRKVYMIDEVHNLSPAAFDALLKTLEEPPSYCTFILCTTELHKIPVTIISRCELYTFNTIEPAQIKERLVHVIKDQNATCEPDALNLIARHSNGALRDALSILEQLLVSTDNNITTSATEKRLGIMDTDIIFTILTALIEFKTSKALESLDELLNKGKSPSLIVEGTLSLITDIITLKATQMPQSILHSKEYILAAQSIEKQVSFEKLFWFAEQYSDLRTSIRGSINPSIDIRLSLIKMSNCELMAGEPRIMAESISQLKHEISILKSTISNLAKVTDTANDEAIPAFQVQQEKNTHTTFISTGDSAISPSYEEIYSDDEDNTPFMPDLNLSVEEKLLPEPSNETPEEPATAFDKSDTSVSVERGGMTKNSKENDSDTSIGSSHNNISFLDLFKRLS